MCAVGKINSSILNMKEQKKWEIFMQVFVSFFSTYVGLFLTLDLTDIIMCCVNVYIEMWVKMSFWNFSRRNEEIFCEKKKSFLSNDRTFFSFLFLNSEKEKSLKWAESITLTLAFRWSCDDFLFISIVRIFHSFGSLSC